MWIITKDGFISVVEWRHDPGCVLVRARVREDLLTLVQDFAIERNPEADYMYRTVVTREELAAWLAKRVDDVCYTSHAKEEMTTSDDGTRDMARYDAYMDVWGALYEGLDERTQR